MDAHAACDVLGSAGLMTVIKGNKQNSEERRTPSDQLDAVSIEHPFEPVGKR
jgi:hypothetical protein